MKLSEILRPDTGTFKPGQKVTIKKSGKTYTLISFMSKGGDKINPWEKWDTKEEGRKDGGVLFHVYGGKPDTHYIIVEAKEIQRQINIFKLSKADRDKLKETDTDKDFIDFCASVDKNNGYTRLEGVDVYSTGTSEEDIIKKVKAKKVTGMLPVISGDIVKVGGIPFLKLLTGEYVEINRKNSEK